MATLKNLHKSISEMSNEEVFNHIRYLRELRREIPVKVARKTVAKKQGNKQISIEEHLKKMGDADRELILKRLLKIKENRDAGYTKD